MANYGTHKTPSIKACLRAIPAFTCTSRRPRHHGSIKSNVGLPRSPKGIFDAARIVRHDNSRALSANTWIVTTLTRDPLSGASRPTTYWQALTVLRARPEVRRTSAINLNTDAIDEVALALPYRTLHDHNRAWKSFDWDVLNPLYERGLIGDPVNKTNSIRWRTISQIPIVVCRLPNAEATCVDERIRLYTSRSPRRRARRNAFTSNDVA